MTCAVFFNLDGTLTDGQVDFESVYYDAVEQADIDGLEDTYEEYTDYFFNFFQRGWAFPRRQAMLELLNNRDITDTGMTDAFAAAWEALEAEHTSFRDGAADVIRRLAETCSIGILTNGTGPLQRMKVENAGVTDDVTALLISSEIGIAKPNAAFFEAAKEQVAADTHIVVSHDLRRDILPAKRENCKTVWIAANDTENNPQIEHVVDARVSSLEDVPDAVHELCG